MKLLIYGQRSGEVFYGMAASEQTWRIRSDPIQIHYMQIWCLYGDDASLRSAEQADVAVFHMAVGGNSLRGVTMHALSYDFS